MIAVRMANGQVRDTVMKRLSPIPSQTAVVDPFADSFDADESLNFTSPPIIAAQQVTHRRVQPP